jgi:UDP-N-acetylglucosamine 2-epimerase
MKLISIVGARPQFIKAAVVSRAIENHNSHISDPNSAINEIIVHTGQHYDHNMSQIFFDTLEIPEPHYNLGVGSGRHGQMTGAMLEKIEKVLIKEKPDCVLVYGDTNTTLAGALAAAKLYLPLGHVEAGLRSYNRKMPEEINRVLTDHVSNFLFCPTETAVKNLKTEGIGEESSLARKLVSSSAIEINGSHAHKLTNPRTKYLINSYAQEPTNSRTYQLTQKVALVGDVMYDAFLFNKKLADRKSKALKTMNLSKGSYCLATVHRAENTDDSSRLQNIYKTFGELASSDCPFIVPIHPRTRKALVKLKVYAEPNTHVRLISPVSYLDMICLEVNAKVILTDSGGVQKEAYFARVPCLTLRDETEWTETLSGGWNHLVGAGMDSIMEGFEKLNFNRRRPVSSYFGNGRSGQKIISILSPETK